MKGVTSNQFNVGRAEQLPLRHAGIARGGLQKSMLFSWRISMQSVIFITWICGAQRARFVYPALSLATKCISPGMGPLSDDIICYPL